MAGAIVLGPENERTLVFGGDGDGKIEELKKKHGGGGGPMSLAINGAHIPGEPGKKRAAINKKFDTNGLEGKKIRGAKPDYRGKHRSHTKRVGMIAFFREPTSAKSRQGK